MFPSPSESPPSLENYQFHYNGLTFGANTPIAVLTEEGLGLSDIRNGDVNWARDHGQSPGLDLLSAKDVIFDLWITAGGTSVQARQLELAAATNVLPDEELPLWFQLPNLPIMCVLCRPRKRSFKIDSDYAAANIDKPELSFHVTDPRIYEAGKSVTYGLGAVVAGKVTAKSETFVNGNTEMRPVATFKGPLTGPKITNTEISGNPFIRLFNRRKEEREERYAKEKIERETREAESAAARKGEEEAEEETKVNRENAEAAKVKEREELEEEAEKAENREKEEAEKRKEREEAEPAEKVENEKPETAEERERRLRREKSEEEERDTKAFAEKKEEKEAIIKAEERVKNIAEEEEAKLKSKRTSEEAVELEEFEKEAKESKEQAEKEAEEESEETEYKFTVKAGDTLKVYFGPVHVIQYFKGGAGEPEDVSKWLDTASTWWDFIPNTNMVAFISDDTTATGGTVTVEWAPANQL